MLKALLQCTVKTLFTLEFNLNQSISFADILKTNIHSLHLILLYDKVNGGN